jgi:YD repeat-containing protein
MLRKTCKPRGCRPPWCNLCGPHKTCIRPRQRAAASARRSRHSAYNADRLIKTILGNGITVDAVYDAASQLTSLTYKKADGSLIGDLQYAYDKAGRRIRQSGSLVTATQPGLGQLPSLPAGASSLTASYDANHRLTSWGGQAYSYDANGNLRQP